MANGAASPVETGQSDEETIRNLVASEIDRRVKKVKWAVGIAMGVATGLGLIGGGDLIRTLHSTAFPSHTPDKVIVSYEGTTVLKASDPQSQSGWIAFYAERGQQVRVHATITRRFAREGSTPKVVITVDGRPFTGPLDRLAGGFHDITEFLSFNTAFQGEPNVHRVGFALDDSSLSDDQSEVTIMGVVLVGRGS